MSLDEIVWWTAEITALVLPFLIGTRWSGVGFVLAVLYGWGIIHLANVLTEVAPSDDGARIRAVFTGVWVCLGWLYMVVWSAVAVCCVVICRWVRGAARRSGDTDFCRQKLSS